MRQRIRSYSCSTAMAGIFVKKHPIIDGQTIQCMFFLVSNNFKGCRSVKNWLIWELF